MQGVLRLAPPPAGPPVMYGQFCLVPSVSVHDRYYCILIIIVTLPVLILPAIVLSLIFLIFIALPLFSLSSLLFLYLLCHPLLFSTSKLPFMDCRYNAYMFCLGPFKCYVTLFFWKLDPPPRNANNIEHYTFVMLFSRKSDTPPPPSALRNT